MNTVQLIGRLTRDPEAHEGNGHQVARMRVAVPGRDRDAEPDYVDVVAFDGLAGTCLEYLEKGRQVGVSGRLNYSEWEAEDGSPRSRHQVIAREVEFLGARRSDEAEGDADQPQQAEPAAA